MTYAICHFNSCWVCLRFVLYLCRLPQVEIIFFKIFDIKEFKAKMSGLFSFLRKRSVFYASLLGTAAGGICFVKDYMQGAQYTNKVTADGKIVIVTGSNCGIGKETVRELAKRGATVYMACRDMKKCEEAREEIVLETYNKNVYCRQCDLASLESVRKFTESFKKEQNRLDILINNAGVSRCPRTLTKDGFEQQFGVNHLGHFYLTNLLLDLLTQSAPSRIINVSSIAHTRGEVNTADLNSEKSYDAGNAYSQSKLANVLFTRELAKRLEGTGVTVNALHPGVVDTEIFRHMAISTNFFAKLLFKPLSWPFVKNAKSGAQTTIYAALDPDLEKVTGMYFSDCNVKDVAPAAKDDAMAKWLWTVSEKWTRVHNN